MKVVTLTLLCFFLLLLFKPAQAQWQYQLQPYLMGVLIDGKTTIGTTPQTDLDVGTSTILEHLESTLMVAFEAHHSSGWGGWIDYSYMDLEAEQSLAGTYVAEANVRQGVLEGALLYRSGTDDRQVDYFAGMRWWNNNLDLNLSGEALPDTLNVGRDVDWVDVFVGVRWQQPINASWQWDARIDVGGFGIGADFTSVMSAGAQYEIKPSMVLTLKYKATWVDYQEGTEDTSDYYEYDTVTHGPVIGLDFRF